MIFITNYDWIPACAGKTEIRGIINFLSEHASFDFLSNKSKVDIRQKARLRALNNNNQIERSQACLRMSMNTEMTNLLLRKEPFSREEWLIFLESARSLLNPRLDKFTLKKFGELACMDNSSGFYQPLSREQPLVSGDFSLEDHGMAYFVDDRQRLLNLEDDASRHIYAYGLSKKGNWVVIDVTVKMRKRDTAPKSNSPLDGGVEYASLVSTANVPLEEMLSKTGARPNNVWMLMVMEVTNWRCKRQMLYEEACKLESQFKIWEELITSILIRPKNS